MCSTEAVTSGPLQVLDEGVSHSVTPLWCAAVSGRVAVVKVLIAKINPVGSFLLPQIYAAWETDEIIGEELWRNVLLAMACVTAVVLLLLANFR